jgi:hypothetical protein
VNLTNLSNLTNQLVGFVMFTCGKILVNKSRSIFRRALFKNFPVGGGAFFEKGPFCEIIY